MTVYLVGAGPGDPGLMTCRGAALLASAQVVVHDRLGVARLTGLASPEAELIDVGKRPGSPVDQGDINRILVESGRSGRRVVRLKGGDPFVFGRGGEEAAALEAAGIPYEVIPGVSAAIAAPAYAGVPLTHRGVATGFTVVTGHMASGGSSGVDWEALARSDHTLVILMGVAERAAIAKKLISAGRDAGLPAMVVQHGTLPSQTVVRTTLGGLGACPVEPPATIVVGAVAALDFGWFERRPLSGLRLVVTRAAEDAGPLRAALEELGADVVTLPTIEIRDPADGGEALRRTCSEVGRYDWAVLTSVNGAERFLDAVGDLRRLGGVKLAAIGPATASVLGNARLRPDLVPEEYVAESLVAAFPPAPPGGRALLPRAAVARDVLPDGLAAKGWEVDVVEAYRTVPAPADPPVVTSAYRADVALFTSPSTVQHFCRLMQEPFAGVAACIGPVTAAEAALRGIEVAVEAPVHTAEGLVEAILAHAATLRSRGSSVADRRSARVVSDRSGGG